MHVISLFSSYSLSLPPIISTCVCVCVCVCLCDTQPYELMNLADALEKKQFSDGECIIKQVSRLQNLSLSLSVR